jgi:uncharacterized protein YacL
MKKNREFTVLILLRIIFVISAVIISYSFANEVFSSTTAKVVVPLIGFALSVLFVGAEIFMTKEIIPFISIVMVGLMVGFLVSYLFIKFLLLLPIFEDLRNTSMQDYLKYESWIKVILTFVITYLVLIIVLKTKSEFKFVIPFIELKKEESATSHKEMYVLDTSVLIDGRIYELVENNVIRGNLIVPRFILEETQYLADLEDKLKRTKGKRGIETLEKLRNSKNITLEIYETQLPFTGTVDQKLIKLCKTLGAVLVSNDFSLCRLAQVEGIKYININILANVLKPVYLPGEEITIKLIKPGENQGQGVGFLDDGTMVVVDNAIHLLGKTINVVVSSIITTTAGRIIFAHLK